MNGGAAPRVLSISNPPPCSATRSAVLSGVPGRFDAGRRRGFASAGGARYAVGPIPT